ncbi:septum site-determining protein MinC [Pseudolysobacter antarcticus]|uniref:Probable septum site-determining protein MinC n=1 Tax=Pseudolysobacter antarcticus TaxID=2511995 RepID=A0A411HL25_9GAMM|nr:septum site-determining protein MinC [Pseudolysobacter antarcticus]QBB71226.1 septum site-determining protein MinC [Pseudolysobacter antarcticus]
MPQRHPVISEQAGELKFGQVGVANLRIRELDIEMLVQEMRQRVETAPQMFLHAPVIVDFSHLLHTPDVETVRQLIAALRETGVLPVGLSYGTTENEALARALDLPLFAKFRASYERSGGNAQEPIQEPARVAVVEAAPVATRAQHPAPPASATAAATIGMLHTKPVRSGQQVYARGRDLILTAAVGNGAEAIADGSIHIYGRLSGRALAGAQGDISARIFCHEFHAELVSIAGQYRVFETIPDDLRGKPVQVWLDGEKLLLAKLG